MGKRKFPWVTDCEWVTVKASGRTIERQLVGSTRTEPIVPRVEEIFLGVSFPGQNELLGGHPETLIFPTDHKAWAIIRLRPKDFRPTAGRRLPRVPQKASPGLFQGLQLQAIVTPCETSWPQKECCGQNSRFPPWPLLLFSWQPSLILVVAYGTLLRTLRRPRPILAAATAIHRGRRRFVPPIAAATL